MDSMTVSQEVALKVSAAIGRSGEKTSTVARAAGIPRTTFMRKLEGHTDFTVGELVRIALALRCDASALAPDVFHAKAAA
jgi:hypothetical protein